METGAQSFEELAALVDGVKLPEAEMAQLETKLSERVNYLEKDIVRKQRKRFMLLEEKVKEMQETHMVAGAKGVDFSKLRGLIDEQLEEDDEGEDGAANDGERTRFLYLWTSELMLLKGMIKIFLLMKNADYRLESGEANYQDIMQLDFNKVKKIIQDYKVDTDRRRALKRAELQRAREEAAAEGGEEKKDEEGVAEGEEEMLLDVSDRVQRVAEITEAISRAAAYAKHS